MAFDDVFGQANAVASDLYAHATESAPGSVDADIGRRLARKLSTDPWVDYEDQRRRLREDSRPPIAPVQPKPTDPGDSPRRAHLSVGLKEGLSNR
jgi:hypothetical protein